MRQAHVETLFVVLDKMQLTNEQRGNLTSIMARWRMNVNGEMMDIITPQSAEITKNKLIILLEQLLTDLNL